MAGPSDTGRHGPGDDRDEHVEATRRVLVAQGRLLIRLARGFLDVLEADVYVGAELPVERRPGRLVHDHVGGQIRPAAPED